MKKGKIFRPQEASRTLPLVSAITHDIITKYRKLQELKSLERGSRPSSPGQETASTNLKEVINKLISEIKYHEEELGQVGCLLKDCEFGIVDYYSELDERMIYLCWQYGEPEVSYWHELHEGDEERKPLPAVIRA